MRCIRIGMLLPTLGKHVLLVRLQHWKLADFLEVARKSTRSTYDRRKCFGCHCIPQSAPAISADCSLYAYRGVEKDRPAPDAMRQACRERGNSKLPLLRARHIAVHSW